MDQPLPRKAEAEAGFWGGSLGYRQAVVTVIAALVVGFYFHWQIGYALYAPPSVILSLAVVFLCGMALAVRNRREHRVIQWLCGAPFAVVVTCAVALLAAVGGVVPTSVTRSILGIPSIFGSWPFILCATLMQVSLVGSSFRRAWPLTQSNLAYVLTHGGLALALTGAALSAGSIERLRAICPYGKTVSVGVTADGESRPLPLGITLRDFSVEYFPPTLGVIERDSAKKEGYRLTPGAKLMASNLVERIGDLTVRVEEYLPKAGKIGDRYVAYMAKTSAPAARIKVTDGSGKVVASGWISSGGPEVAASLVQVTPDRAVAMAALRPKRFHSTVEVTTEDRTFKTPLEVNRPITVGNTRIYQLDYDVNAGAASEYLVVEIVHDPSVPVVYSGLGALLLGVVLSFWLGVGATARRIDVRSR